jgi:hypothetical protein
MTVPELPVARPNLKPKQQRAGKKTDFFLSPSSNHFFNSIWWLRPATPRAEKHLRKYYGGPDHTWSGGRLIVETNYVDGLCEHLRGQGFTVRRLKKAAQGGAE